MNRIFAAARDLQEFCSSRDVERIFMRQGPKLRVDQILSELHPLVKAKEEPQVLNRLQIIFDRYLGD